MPDTIQRPRFSAKRHRVALDAVLRDVGRFSAFIVKTPLREYQLEVARAVLRSVAEGSGLTLTVLMPRQAGKNELSAQLEGFLLTQRMYEGGSLVKCAPTFRPQLHNSIARLGRVLENGLTKGSWDAHNEYQIRVGKARIAFYSAERRANVVGATADVLLECDEAQDVDQQKWDRDFRPMGATTNVTSVLYGTPWTDDTLLARQIVANREAESRDSVRRHFEVDWSAVAAENPAYGRHVEAEIARLGARHPIVRTQYLLEALGRGGRLFDAAQLALLRGDHQPQTAPAPGQWGPGFYVAGVDVAGADAENPDGERVRVSPKRDCTVLTIAFVEQARVGKAVVEPRLHIVRQYVWRGTAHRVLYPQILSLIEDHWRCVRAVVDATGVGGGLAALLGAALGPRVVQPFVYTAASKSALAYDLLAAVNAGRVRVYAESADEDANESRRELLSQCDAAEYSLRANQTMQFFVPDSRGHDDLLNALALLVQGAPLGQFRHASGRRAASGEL